MNASWRFTVPIYEYRCDKCGQEFELFRSITDKGTPSCKSCDGPVQKLISRSSFHLKGTGWYVTDYAGKKPSDQEEKKEATSASSSDSAKKEESTPKKKSEDASD
jgi:putative FmdB family regulatory protein